MRAAFGMAATVTGGCMGIYRRKHRDPETGKVRLGHYYYKFTMDGVTYKQTVKTAHTPPSRRRRAAGAR